MQRNMKWLQWAAKQNPAAAKKQKPVAHRRSYSRPTKRIGAPILFVGRLYVKGCSEWSLPTKFHLLMFSIYRDIDAKTAELSFGTPCIYGVYSMYDVCFYGYAIRVRRSWDVATFSENWSKIASLRTENRWKKSVFIQRKNPLTVRLTHPAVL